MVIRISRASFPAADFAIVKARLDASQEGLRPAVTALNGCLHYWACIDPLSNTMANVSIWESLEHAKQMDTLAPMLALAGEFVRLGVTFERPIVNSDVLWEL